MTLDGGVLTDAFLSCCAFPLRRAKAHLRRRSFFTPPLNLAPQARWRQHAVLALPGFRRLDGSFARQQVGGAASHTRWRAHKACSQGVLCACQAVCELTCEVRQCECEVRWRYTQVKCLLGIDKVAFIFWVFVRVLVARGA